jgi:hypothetical protein
VGVPREDASLGTGAAGNVPGNVPRKALRKNSRNIGDVEGVEFGLEEGKGIEVGGGNGISITITITTRRRVAGERRGKDAATERGVPRVAEGDEGFADGGEAPEGLDGLGERFHVVEGGLAGLEEGEELALGGLGDGEEAGAVVKFVQGSGGGSVHAGIVSRRAGGAEFPWGRLTGLEGTKSGEFDHEGAKRRRVTKGRRKRFYHRDRREHRENEGSGD